VTTVDAMKKCNKAGSGCRPMLKDLINGTLTAPGPCIENVLCEHRDYPRQELFDLLKTNDIRTYGAALDQFGTGGAGCEICEPAVGSILAGPWNDLIVKQNVIQDPNDRCLANLQKGGSYSLMPRGEVSPR